MSRAESPELREIVLAVFRGSPGLSREIAPGVPWSSKETSSASVGSGVPVVAGGDQVGAAEHEGASEGLQGRGRLFECDGAQEESSDGGEQEEGGAHLDTQPGLPTAMSSQPSTWPQRAVRASQPSGPQPGAASKPPHIAPTAAANTAAEAMVMR